MKMIEVLQKVANGEIKDQTTLKIYDPHVLHTYTFEGKYNSFYSNTKYRRELGGYFKISGDFLNYEVELIPPKEKKYLVKVNIKGLIKELTVLNYQRLTGKIHLGSPGDTNFVKTSFTKSEMQSIKLVREFLDDMQGKYELIEVEE
ncbi:hypothetical protein MMJ61_00910 [Enterococcus cecorum]|uniref:hypothetical protein n=1 Tax=Enterococcus cecorum TaxID=44008 RepID=UPI001FAC4338|nr:hypothetical protein [Enterococcus cecorum]MCJ0570764.1 hypothetical protein [Enterococcus cecorum]MCJ0589214.1 hypothetical protein [Enterococcus cecorum]MDZ5578607.1 hypothetical protein [Enterococcus cecorum]